MIDQLKRLLVFSLAVNCSLIADAAEPWQVVRIHKVSLEGTLKEGTPFEVNIEAKKPKASRSDYFGGGQQVEAVVAEITVKLGGEKVSFPKPAFEDLANASLQTVSLTSQPSGELKLRFTGGTGAASYDVEYLIGSNRLAKRTISYFEAPDGSEKHQVVKTMTF
jgi:hypothetical protein